MKKLTTLLIAVLCCCTLFAQRIKKGDVVVNQKKSALFIGVKAGATFTGLSESDGISIADGSGVGFSAGVVAKARFGVKPGTQLPGSGYFGAGIELKYKQNTAKTKATDETGKENANMSLGYFELPIYAQVFPFAKSKAMNGLYIEVGPSIAGTLSRSPKSLTYNNVEYVLDGDKKLKGFDVRILAGIGYDIPFTKTTSNGKSKIGSALGVNLRYYMGTSKLAKNFPVKMNTLEFSVSYSFNALQF